MAYYYIAHMISYHCCSGQDQNLAHFRDDLKSVITCNWTLLEERVANTNTSKTHHIRG